MATRKKALANMAKTALSGATGTHGQVAKRTPSSTIRSGGSMTPKTAPVATQPRTGGQIGAITLTPSEIASRNPAPRVNNTAMASAPKNRGQAQSAMAKRRNTVRKAVKSAAFLMKKKKP